MEKFTVIHKATGDKRRCEIEPSGNYFVLLKGCRKQGVRCTPEQFEKYYEVIEEKGCQKRTVKTDTEEWHDRLKKAIKKMDVSDVWPDVKEIYKQLLAMTWEDHREIQNSYRYVYSGNRNEVVDKYKEKYPFIFNDENKIISDYINGLSDCKLKTMYFGKSKNKEIKECIKKALETKTSYESPLIRDKYDLQFTYDPKKKRATYIEEYKRCGNGHYYLALDANTAVWCEDD